MVYPPIEQILVNSQDVLRQKHLCPMASSTTCRCPDLYSDFRMAYAQHDNRRDVHHIPIPRNELASYRSMSLEALADALAKLYNQGVSR
jgi:hypothetical protein